MTEPMNPSATTDTQPIPGVFSRFIGVITSPGETFKHVVRAPKVAGMLAVCGLLMGLAGGLPQLTERGKAAAFENQVQAMERFSGRPVDDATYEQMRQRSQGNLGAIMAILGTLVTVPIFSVILTAVLWAIFNTVLGGTATFKQVMAIVVHAQAIPTLSMLVSAPIMYARGTMSMTGVANIGALLPMLDESSLMGRFLGMVDLFSIWWLVVVAIGLAQLYKRTTGGIATGLFIAYALLLLGVASFLG